MRALAFLVLAILSLSACAHRKQTTAGCATTMLEQADAWNRALQGAYPDPRGHRSLIKARVTDADGNRVSEADVWPLSGPQAPAPAKKVRVVQNPCTLEILSIVRLVDPDAAP
jgi:hypothetical protein